MRTIKMILNTVALSTHKEAVRASLSVKSLNLSKAEKSMAFKFGVGPQLELLHTLIRRT
jgi:hypothetical protein